MQPRPATAYGCENQTCQAFGVGRPTLALTWSPSRLPDRSCTMHPRLGAHPGKRASSVSSGKGCVRLQAHDLVRSGSRQESIGINEPEVRYRLRTYVRRWHGFPSRDEADLDQTRSRSCRGFRGSDSRRLREFRDLTDGPSIYQRSNLGPSTAPVTVHKTIVPPYQSAMKGSRSSMQCKA